MSARSPGAPARRSQHAGEDSASKHSANSRSWRTRTASVYTIVIEFFDGITLLEWMQGKPVAPLQAAQFVENVARIMHYAHELGVVHRNLKPTSILVAAKANQPLSRFPLKIDGFGLAGRPLEGDINDLELQGKLPHYLSPEQAWGYSKDIGPCSDVYGGLGRCCTNCWWADRRSRVNGRRKSSSKFAAGQPRRRARSTLGCRWISMRSAQVSAKTAAPSIRSALALADDLRRYQDRMPISARDFGLITRLFLWTRRRPALAFILLLLFGMFFSTLVAFVIGLTIGEGNNALYYSALNSRQAAQQELLAVQMERNQALQRDQLATYYQDIALADAGCHEMVDSTTPACS